MAAKHIGLGRGLNALLGDDTERNRQEAAGVPKDNSFIIEIDVNKIDTSLKQPRKTFEQEKLEELADSIRTHGVIQPIIVRQNGERYTIVAGERRYRAARMAGLSAIPVIIKNLDGKEHMEVSLIENLQREDLNPIEEAAAVKVLMDEYGLTQESVSQRIGKSRSAVANNLRLLALPYVIRELLRKGKISPGHAKCLVALPEEKMIIDIANKIIDKKLSVRETEKLAGEAMKPESEQKRKKRKTRPELVEAQERLTEALETRVVITGSLNKGRINIEYFSKEQLEDLYDTLIKSTGD